MSILSAYDRTDPHKEWDLATTAVLGSPWGRSLSDLSLAATNLDEPQPLDYWNLPGTESMGFVEDSPYDLMSEIARAKEREDFPVFMKWLQEVVGCEDDFVWGLPDGDPLEDFKDFANWLVETGQGRWEPTSDPDIEVIEKKLPDNQLADSDLYPMGDVTYIAGYGEPDQEEFLGEIPFNRGKWRDLLSEVMEGKQWWTSYAVGGGFLIDFVSPTDLKYEPHKNQFPLRLYRRLLPDIPDTSDENAKTVETPEDQAVVPATAPAEADHAWGGEEWWDNDGWDFQDEWEAPESEVDQFSKDLEEAYEMACPLNAICLITISFHIFILAFLVPNIDMLFHS